MPDPEREAEDIRTLRHDLANPLAAILAEAQLLLLDEDRLRAETVGGLREIEALVRRMREMLRPPHRSDRFPPLLARLLRRACV
ncbi:MAG: hypothetical protein ABR998_13270 [Gemmatimonadales bacterium]|jgi:signal transduction histidine kinase